MTFAEDEFALDEGFDEASDYPVAFGITFTPQVSGISFALLGLVAAGYVLMTFVQPAWQQFQTLRSSIDEKETQVAQQAVIQNQIAELETQVQQAEAKQDQVLALFADERNLDTLLLDLNRFVEARQGELISFTPQGEPAIVNDGSLGAPVNNKLKRQSINLQVEGTFDQIQSIMQSLERLQSLLLVKGYSSQITEEQTATVNNGQVILSEPPTLQTTFQIDALVPLSEEEKAELAAAEQATQETQAQEGQ
jgi:type IV pilus assembly protein PilO